MLKYYYMKIKIILLSLLLAINVFNYFIIQVNAKDKIEIVLQEKQNTLYTHYQILSHMQQITASTIFQSTVEIPGLLKILTEANSATSQKKENLRKRFHKLIVKKYALIQEKGVLQYQFVLRNNESFYRAHKPNSFGDDLTNIRTDFKYTNETQKSISGLVQGKFTHGFRNTFPLYNTKNEHIGAVEISFSSNSVQSYLNNVNKVHSHFLVAKNVLAIDANIKNHSSLQYTQSAEHKGYLFVANKLHTEEKCFLDNKKNLDSIRVILDAKIALLRAFSVYVDNPNGKNGIQVISFIPIKNLDNKVRAWIVSYEASSLIESILFNSLVLYIISALLSIIVIAFLFRAISSKQKVQEQHKFVNDILNATDNIMFITDFKKIKFANQKLQELLHISQVQHFDEKNTHPLLQLFQEEEGYLHQALLRENESFVSLLTRTAQENRVVSIIDEHYEAKAFKISITKTQDKENFLITLSDITKIKEQQVKAQKRASIDRLTQVYNRHKFDEIFTQEIEYTKRYNTPLSLAVLDVDKFKDFNDKYGHLIGDEVLIALAQTIQSETRDTDTFARWGGEEFVILFKNTTVNNALIAANKFKESIENSSHSIAGTVTASFGVAEFQNGDTTETLFRRCDAALYRAKKHGRNRVEML